MQPWPRPGQGLRYQGRPPAAPIDSDARIAERLSVAGSRWGRWPASLQSDMAVSCCRRMMRDVSSLLIWPAKECRLIGVVARASTRGRRYKLGCDVTFWSSRDGISPTLLLLHDQLLPLCNAEREAWRSCFRNSTAGLGRNTRAELFPI
jgi:hypothetical protein